MLSLSIWSIDLLVYGENHSKSRLKSIVTRVVLKVERMVAATMSGFLRDAQMNDYALGYFEVWNLESTRALVEAAEEQRAPLIVGFSGSLLEAIDGLEYYAALAKVAVEKARVPAVSLLNEPSNFQQVMQGLRYGFMSVMVDFSEFPFGKNVALTNKVAEICHSMGVAVEAQIDEIPSARNGALPKNVGHFLTGPQKAVSFVETTKVDALSVSVGNVHGLYKDKARLDFERIRELGRAVKVPLVLHGGTGISDDSARKAIKSGICKINIGAELRYGFLDGVRETLKEKPQAFPEQIFKLGEESFKDIVKKKMEVYGCAHRV